MAVGLKPPEVLAPVHGVRLGVAKAGIRRGAGDDVLLVECAAGSRFAGAFTQNAFCAAPVTVCRSILDAGDPVRGFVVNAGNANAGTGAAGLDLAWAAARRGGELLGDADGLLLPFSTGVIGQALDRAQLLEGMRVASANLSEDNWMAAAKAIVTTDTMPKGYTRKLQTSAGDVTITGIAKGAGMICPDLATMLAFIACDAKLSQAALDAILREGLNASFNRITVDGDTSTNDGVLLCASGAVGDVPVDGDSADYMLIRSAIHELMTSLAQAIVRDAEGASKFVTISVQGARDAGEARRVAYTIAHSPLVKTAWFASDANWGRILAAVGRAGLTDLDIDRVDLYLDDVCLIRGGQPAPDYAEAAGAAVMAKSEFQVRVQLGRGDVGAQVWTCDLGHDYVRINADYRS